MINRFDKEMRKYFTPYRNNTKVMEFKEELLSNLMERAQEYQGEGLNEEESYVKSLALLDGIEDTILELSEQYPVFTKTKLMKKKGDVLFYSAIFWLVVVVVYSLWSFISKDWGITWLTFIGGVYAYLISGGVVMYYKLKEKKKDLASRIIRALVSMTVVTIIYLVVSLLTKIWAVSWVIILGGIIITDIIDILSRKEVQGKRLMTLIETIGITVLLAVIAFILISFVVGSFSITWLIFLFMVIVILFEIMARRKK